jgi:hypothetical protein
MNYFLEEVVAAAVVPQTILSLMMTPTKSFLQIFAGRRLLVAGKVTTRW